MSDTETRNTDGMSAEPLLGTDQLERDLGYEKLPEPAAPESEASTIEQEAANLKASRAEVPNEVVPLRYQDRDGEKLPENLTVSQERASKDLNTYHAALNDTAERHVSAEFRAEVLKQRAELVAANPETAELLGIDADDTITKAIEANPELAQPAERPPTRQPDQADTYNYDGIEGLEPATREALKQPQIRQYLEANATETDQSVQTFKAATDNALKFGQGALQAIAPELERVPVERWAEAINIISQTDPVKGQMIAKTLSNIAALGERKQLVEHYEQTTRQAQFDSLKAQYSKASDQLFNQMSFADKHEMAQELMNYVGEHGVSQQTFLEEAKTNLLLHHPAFQSLAKDALNYRRMMKAPKPHPTRSAVPMTPPGVSSGARSGNNSSTIKGLERQLSNATTQQSQLKIAARLLAAKRG